MSSIKIKCICGKEFVFSEDNISEGQVYEAECPYCHVLLKRRKTSNNQPGKSSCSDSIPVIKMPEIETTKCPVCGEMKLRIGDFGIQDIREEFRVVCDSCDFSSETESVDCGECFGEFMREEYYKVAKENYLKENPAEIIAWTRTSDNNYKIKYSDGEIVFVSATVFDACYKEITSLSKEALISKLPNLKVFNKLVRDKIPKIIESNGECYTAEILNDDLDYLKALQRKLDEEVAEYHKDDTIEELADIVEVVYALVKAHGISKEYFEKVVADKRNKKGGFEKRIFLKETYNANSDN